jgi:hypothetical protein
MKVKDLKRNERNPRKIGAKQKKALKKSVDKFGDLGGIIYNVRSKRLVGGHQRSSVLSPNDKIEILNKYESPTKSGTVAEGFVVTKGGEKYSYREVDWDKSTESEAMIAANKHSGDWDNDLLRVAMADVSDLEVTGFEAPELEELNIEIPNLDLDQADSEYVANTPQETEQIPTSNPNENVKVEKKSFDDVEEETEVKGKRYVIIIDCKDDENKKEVREKILPLVEEAGARIF